MTKEELLRQIIQDLGREHGEAEKSELEDTPHAEGWREGYMDGLWYAEERVTELLKEAKAESYL